MMEFLTWDTNEAITAFLVNNFILLWMIKKIVEYISEKTPFTWDDDLAPFIGGLIKGPPKADPKP